MEGNGEAQACRMSNINSNQKCRPTGTGTGLQGTATKPSDISNSVPDGGWGWVVTLASFFINIIIIGTHNCFGILYLDLVEEFQQSLSKTAWVGSIAFGCILVFAPVSGALANVYGCRKSISILQFTYGFGFGFGTSLCYTQGAVMVARYFSSHRALASGIGLAGSTLGTLVMAPVYDGVRRCFGWRGSLRIISGCAGLTLLCAATYRPLTTTNDAKMSSGQQRKENLSGKKIVAELSLWKNKAFLVWAVGVGLAKLGYLIPWVHMVKLSTDLQLSRHFGSSLLQYMGISATVSRLITGKIADSPHVNRLYLSQFSAFLMGVINLTRPSFSSKGGLLFYALSLGILDGGIEILLPVMTLDLVGAEKLSLAWGCILAVISVSSMGPPLAGEIRELTGSYDGAFYLAGVPLILSAFTLCLIPVWAKHQPQVPASSILSIDPSHLNLDNLQRRKNLSEHNVSTRWFKEWQTRNRNADAEMNRPNNVVPTTNALDKYQVGEEAKNDKPFTLPLFQGK
ncbi:monocarboxylate transporter 10-like isoform X2 [Clavelina lepadiformis]|uniref:monocarboxylate transporter 10-like isoform X2 n=1 Tax=Clavelina lepadiformis TaxID=159417 RepID=UPI004042E5C4